MQFELIRAPIRLEGSAGEAGDDELWDVVPGDAVRRRSLIADRIPPCPGRMGDVLNEGQDLRHGDAKAHDDRCHCDGESYHPLPQWIGTRLYKRPTGREKRSDDKQEI